MLNRWCAGTFVLLITSCTPQLKNPPDSLGPAPSGGFLVSTKQLIRPAGQSVEFAARPVDIALSPDGRSVYVKNDGSLLMIDKQSWQVRQRLAYAANEGGSMYGLAVSRDGRRVFVTTTANKLREANVEPDGKLNWVRTIDLKPPTSKTNVYPCGVAISDDGVTAYVCLSMANALCIVDLTTGKVSGQIPVGVAPYSVVLAGDGKTAYVTNWGGRRPKKGEHTAKSAGTDTLVDEHGVAASGTVGIIDLSRRTMAIEIAVGLHPADLKLSRDGARLYVANANSDSVSVIDTAARRVTQTIIVRPDPALPFGSASNGLALSADGKRLFVANGGNNAVAVVNLNHNSARIEGFIPAGWYPGAVIIDGQSLFIANVKGVGSRHEKPKQRGWSVLQYLGTVTRVDLPTPELLSQYTNQVMQDAQVPQTLAAWEKAQSDVPAKPVPQHVGEPSVFEHVVYVIKENRTYDQVLGDIGKGNSDPRLCVFNRHITPNLHALAEQFVLLDNFYCNGVISADGHAWATEGVAVDYLEKSFGGFSRSYPFSGDDPLAMASTGFIWDNALLHGKSFRNYGEMAKTDIVTKGAGFSQVYADYLHGTHRAALKQTIYIDLLRQYSCLEYPGWNLKVPDAVRMKVFMKEFEAAKSTGQWPNFVTVYLPSDHTSGTAENAPTPAAQAADNDLAVGKLVEAISHSSFWPKTCIFVIEDDPQAGFDHVDGHRSVCWVVSPYTKRGAIVSDFYNQTSVLHTMELILGLPPMNQMDAMAPAMHACFTDQPDLRPFAALPNRVPLDQMNPKKTKLAGKDLELAQQSEAFDLTEPDRADENKLNRILWHALRGPNDPYPAGDAGAHGKGLEKLRLKKVHLDDDDD